MKLAILTVLSLSLAGCALLQQLEGGGTGGTATTTTAAAGTPGGVNCGVDPDTSATLCLGNTLCPGITIDSEVLPGCGFRVNGAAVDIECSCSGWLCPLGATSCADATAKLVDATYGTVCSQLGNGTCVEGTPVASASSSSSGGGTCDTTCRTECAGEPTCIQACGC